MVSTRSLAAVLIVGVLALALVVVVYSLSAASGDVTTGLPSRFTVNGRTFSITFTASTDSERQHGLMNTKVTNTTFELFAWPTPGRHAFWMYQTNSSLDMIWMNETSGVGKVVYVVDGAPSCYNLPCTTYEPTSAANYVLEAKAGFAQQNNITVGTTVQFS